MQTPIFIGDPLSAAGFRLGGAEVITPRAGSEEAAFRTALKDAELVLITAETASGIPDAILKKAMLENDPLVVVIPDVRNRQRPLDIGNSLRRQLGMTE